MTEVGALQLALFVASHFRANFLSVEAFADITQSCYIFIGIRGKCAL
jgi:hypothetical protein